MNQSDYYLAFSLSPGIGPKRFLALLHKFGSPENAWKAFEHDKLQAVSSDVGIGAKTYESIQQFQKSFDINEYKKKLTQKNVQFIPQSSKNYPKELKDLQDPPIGLFLKGAVEYLLSPQKISIVGTRKITSYGRQVTEKLTSELVLCDFAIVSGLALGIDACAHKSALDNNGSTIGVLGCGVDCCYPRENQFLYDQIVSSKGAVVSEYPLATHPSKGTFLARNRIVAALSSGILIPEAGEDSGSLTTAKFGFALNKKVFAIPGPITSSQSYGTALLLKSGALLVQHVEDITSQVGIQEKKESKSQEDYSYLSVDEQTIVNFLRLESMSLDELMRKTHIPIQKLSMMVSELEIKGIIVQSANKCSVT